MERLKKEKANKNEDVRIVLCHATVKIVRSSLYRWPNKKYKTPELSVNPIDNPSIWLDF